MGARERGDIYIEIDGFYVFSPHTGSGAFTASNLRDVADYLDELNEPWNKTIDEYFER